MTIEALRAAKSEAEAEILQVLRRLREKTGLGTVGVRLTLIDHAHYGAAHRVEVTEVGIELEKI